jgi:hypothetical protein
MRRVRLGSTVGVRVVVAAVVLLSLVAVGITALDVADAGEVPVAFVAVTAKV